MGTKPMFKLGDRVAFSRLWLRSAGAYTGALPFARGEVIETRQTPGTIAAGVPQIVRVRWDKPEELAGEYQYVAAHNLVLEERIYLEPV